MGRCRLDDEPDDPLRPEAVRRRGLAFAAACEPIAARERALMTFVVRSSAV